MTAPDQPARFGFVEQWIHCATEDARAAAACLTPDPPILSSAAYHCQQAAEKFLKGALVLARVDFRKTHNLVWLGELVIAALPDLRPSVAGVVEMTGWDIAYRYPGEAAPAPEPSIAEVEQALVAIAALTEGVRSQLHQTRDGPTTA